MKLAKLLAMVYRRVIAQQQFFEGGLLQLLWTSLDLFEFFRRILKNYEVQSLNNSVELSL